MKKRKVYLGIVSTLVTAALLAIPVMAAERVEADSAQESGTEETIEAEEPEPENPVDMDETDGTDDSGDTGGTDEPDDPLPDSSDWNGFHQDPDSGDWYYYTDGQVDTSITDVVKGTVNETNGWWNVVVGKVTHGETVAKNANGWWYIDETGMVDFNANTVAKNENGWWYILNGKVQFNFTGLANYSNKNGWWYIKNGKVDFSHNGVDKNKNGWWYMTGGKVQFGFTGLANYKNENGWWYIKNGKVDFTHTGVDKNVNGWWYVNAGKVQFSYTGLAKNSNGWWYLNGGKVLFDTCLTDAAQFVGAHTSTTESNVEKLDTCYKYMRSVFTYQRFYDTPTAADLPGCAVYYFQTGKGNCYRHAAAITCIAKVLGFETKTAVGQIDSTASPGEMTAHGWCEVLINGTWYIYDVSQNYFKLTHAEYPRILSADHIYTLTISNEKAVWK